MARVLLVDDEKNLRVTLGEFLRGDGHEVDAAEDAAKAEALLSRKEYDVVVTDIILPRVSGVELLKRIRATAPNTLVIMMTGEPTVETSAQALRDGAVDYLLKPCTKHAILRAVGNAARIKTLADEKRALEEANRRHLENLEQLVAERTRQLLAAQKMEAIGRLAGGVAHDFNNLLTGIIGYTNFAIQQAGANAELLRDLTQVRELGERAAGLTRQLLAFSRRQTLALTRVDLNELIQNLFNLIGRIIGENIHVKLDLTANPATIQADPGQIEQVLMNLAINARDAMPTGGELTIQTATGIREPGSATGQPQIEPGPYVQLTVTDGGTGMNAETLARLFEPFFTTKAIGKGTGLGLATVYGIVTQHRGCIWAESEAGKGSTFRVCLPISSETPALVRSPAAPAVERGTETILVVEDEDYVLNYVRTVMENQGYRVLTATNATEAQAIFEQRGPAVDLLLTDVMLPGPRNGRELFEALCALKPGLRVLYMSGYTDDVILQHAIHDQSAALIQKPLEAEALLRKVQEVMRKDGNPGT